MVWVIGWPKHNISNFVHFCIKTSEKQGSVTMLTSGKLEEILKQYGRWVYCVKFKCVPKQIQSLGILKPSLAILNSYYRFRDCPSTDTAGFILWKGMTHSANSWMWFDSVSLRYTLLLMLLFLSWSLLICIFPKWLCLLVKWESHLTWSS